MPQGTLSLPEPFSLGLTLLCGQAFRWDGPDIQGRFQGIAGGAWWRLRQAGGRLDWECGEDRIREREPGEWLSHYLALDEDWAGWAREAAGHPVLAGPVRVLRGLRLLRQEPWECSVSYMFAQGLSVRLIRRVLGKFCGRYGREIGGPPGSRDFPAPSDLLSLSPDVLRPFTNNYRARADRIIRFSRAVEAQVLSLEHLRGIPCDDAREALMALDGIGPKIADCILLFSLGHGSSFPVDRWVLRAMRRHFRSVRLLGGGVESPAGYSRYLGIVRKARKAFGERCGWASEYLFLYLRLLEDGVLRGELAPFCAESVPVAAVPAQRGKRAQKIV